MDFIVLPPSLSGFKVSAGKTAHTFGDYILPRRCAKNVQAVIKTRDRRYAFSQEKCVIFHHAIICQCYFLQLL